ncbi:SMR family transporter [Pseudooceanicola nanhaiensis]|jgi:small multidrug resistance pump|uniref:Multidrug transporter n=1 Tax=Pseudooceanicola nanhaiensis TaxID=375761 RepID=A0A917WKW7_9RHOB|nr:SMR family transporter [Pseudooceanicola nanhaiensis]GGM11718.1 multidrug transporter [Pseudooceanicola nanhaiensis]
MSLPLAYVLLAIAITSEVIATTALALSDGLSKPLPVVISALGYALALGLLAVVMRVMPTGVVYAIWSGLGVVLITLVAWAWQGQRLDLPAVIGMGLIVAGVIVVNVFSGSVGH